MARRTFSPQEIATQRNMQRQRRLLTNPRPPLESVEADENSVRIIDVEEDIDAQARQFMVRRPPGWWMMRNGFWIPIERMSDNHFENAWRMINSRQRDTEIIQEFQMERARRERNRLYAAQSQEGIQEFERNRLERRRIQDAHDAELIEMSRRIQEIARNVHEGGIYAGIDRSGPEQLWEPLAAILSSTPITPGTPTPPLPNRTRRIKE